MMSPLAVGLVLGVLVECYRIRAGLRRLADQCDRALLPPANDSRPELDELYLNPALQAQCRAAAARRDPMGYAAFSWEPPASDR